MSTLVIYDSVFGNTEKIAQAIGIALGCSVKKAGDVQPTDLQGVNLLIVGSPTRAFQPMPTVKACLKNLPKLNGVRAAAFDTHFSDENMKKAPGILRLMARIFGNSAAAHIAKQLAAKGAVPACSPEWFGVEASEGPLSVGELERAAVWARKLR
ncbi:MAG: flavodoxin family protein [Anaerolineae bacterium]